MAATSIHVVSFGDAVVSGWPAGRHVHVRDWRELPEALADLEAASAEADAVLLWGLPAAPRADRCRDLLRQPDHVWHSGLGMGMAGLPAALDFVAPTWRFNRDAAPERESMSWRLSLRACLIRTGALRAVGPPDTAYDTETGSSLDYGRRLLGAGALLRHLPDLGGTGSPCPPLTVADELRFVARHHGRQWAMWAGARELRHQPGRSLEVLRALRAVGRRPSPPAPGRIDTVASDRAAELRVSVLIPTIERYPYLRVVLDQLRRQTVPPHQVIVIDQTPAGSRDHQIARDLVDLPLQLLVLDRAGQSSARNAGLRRVTGDAVLFVDDDDEIEPDLIERHLRNLAVEGIDASCGIAHEPDLEVAHQPRHRQASAVFPTNNSMLRTCALDRSGLFDLAFDHGVRADADLGMRLYLSGARMVLDPTIDVLHHRAPRGGLRQYGQRKTTYSGSRSSLLERQELQPTEVYLARRYFSSRQVTEMLSLRRWSTLSRHGSPAARLARAVIQLLFLPRTNRDIRRACERAAELEEQYPDIPQLHPDEAATP